MFDPKYEDVKRLFYRYFQFRATFAPMTLSMPGVNFRTPPLLSSTARAGGGNPPDQACVRRLLTAVGVPMILAGEAFADLHTASISTEMSLNVEANRSHSSISTFYTIPKQRRRQAGCRESTEGSAGVCIAYHRSSRIAQSNPEY